MAKENMEDLINLIKEIKDTPNFKRAKRQLFFELVMWSIFLVFYGLLKDWVAVTLLLVILLKTYQAYFMEKLYLMMRFVVDEMQTILDEVFAPQRQVKKTTKGKK